MDFINASPNPESLRNNNITPNTEQKPLKVKIIKLKGLDDQLYSIVFNLLILTSFKFLISPICSNKLQEISLTDLL